MAICSVTARPAVKPQDLEAAINSELENLRTHGVTQPELDHARNVILAKKIESLQRLGGFGGVADTLNLYNQYLGDPGYLQRDVQRFQNATIASLQPLLNKSSPITTELSSTPYPERKLSTMSRVVDKYFGNWTGTGNALPALRTPPAPKAPNRHIVIVDKPGAPQTALVAFGIGLPRTTADYPSVEIMNSALGGLFSSRINMNLREKNGFSYSAFSFFWYHRGTGPFIAGALVRTDVTGPAARELFSELKRIRTHPPTTSELRVAQQYAFRSLPGQFETVGDTSLQIGELFIYGLPLDYYRKLPGQYQAVTLEAAQRAATNYVHPENFVLIAVGDRAKIQPQLKKLNLGPIELRNENGDPLSN